MIRWPVGALVREQQELPKKYPEMQVKAPLDQAQVQDETRWRAMRGQEPIALPLGGEDEATLALAQSFRFGPHDSLAGWRFGAGPGPVVVLVHGWGGQGTQFLRMAKR